MSDTTDTIEARGRQLERRVVDVGEELRTALRELVGGLPEGPRSPGALATVLSLDKVLATRAMSHLIGASAETSLAAMFLHPSEDLTRSTARRSR